MRKTAAAVVVAGLALAGTSTAGAHDLVDHDATCQGVSASFANFPDAPNIITITGTTSTDRTFDGPSGTVTATWDALGVEVGGTVTYRFAWTVDGGGQVGPFTFDTAPCVPTIIPPVVITPPAAEPVTGAVPPAPAALAAAAQPRFTG